MPTFFLLPVPVGPYNLWGSTENLDIWTLRGVADAGVSAAGLDYREAMRTWIDFIKSSNGSVFPIQPGWKVLP